MVLRRRGADTPAALRALSDSTKAEPATPERTTGDAPPPPTPESPAQEPSGSHGDEGAADAQALALLMLSLSSSVITYAPLLNALATIQLHPYLDLRHIEVPRLPIADGGTHCNALRAQLLATVGAGEERLSLLASCCVLATVK